MWGLLQIHAKTLQKEDGAKKNIHHPTALGNGAMVSSWRS